MNKYSQKLQLSEQDITDVDEKAKKATLSATNLYKPVSQLMCEFR